MRPHVKMSTCQHIKVRACDCGLTSEYPATETPLKILLPQSRSRHNLYNKLYIKTTNIPRSFIHCGPAVAL